MNFLKQNIGLIYFILPYIQVVENKFGLVSSLFFGRKNYQIKLKDNISITFPSSKFSRMMDLLGILTFSSYFSKKDDQIEFSFDTKNKFSVPIKNLSYEDENLLELFFGSIKHGANFITDDNVDMNNYRDKTFKILKHEGKKIIETPNGIKFYIDSIHPGNSIIETFVRKIHLMNPNLDFKDKVVVDVGAECGDTPLYFAGLGAKVFAFEPVKQHYDDMMRNISLNPKLSKNIIPINVGIGKDGYLTFYQDGSGIVGSTSFIENVHGKDAKELKVKGLSLESALKEYDIEHVDLLKMDCKGCEFFLTENSLKNVDRIKIEFSKFSNFELDDILNLLEKVGFEYMTFITEPSHHVSPMIETNIYATKKEIS